MKKTILEKKLCVEREAFELNWSNLPGQLEDKIFGFWRKKI